MHLVSMFFFLLVVLSGHSFGPFEMEVPPDFHVEVREPDKEKDRLYTVTVKRGGGVMYQTTRLDMKPVIDDRWVESKPGKVDGHSFKWRLWQQKSEL